MASEFTAQPAAPDVKIYGSVIMFDDFVEHIAPIVSNRLDHFLAGGGVASGTTGVSLKRGAGAA